MQTPEKLLEKLGKTPTDPDRLLEYINVIDQKQAEIVNIIDSHETNMIKLIIFAEAFKQVLIDKTLTEEEFQQYLEKAASMVKNVLSTPDAEPDDTSTKVSDIVV